MPPLRHRFRSCTAGLLLLAAACSEHPTDHRPGAPTQARVLAGDTQTARVSDTLPDPVRLLVTDETGAPLPGIPVHAVVTRGDGDILAPDQVTLPDGTALFYWVLGPISGPQTMEVRIEGLGTRMIGATATGCDLPECPQYRIAVGTLQEMDLSTYDLSSEVVHPDVLVRTGRFGSPWYWMAITPYPGGNPFYENPSIYRSVNGRYWRKPKGLLNPVAWPTGEGHLSDPDLVYDPEADDLRLYYREVVDGRNLILLKRSPWGAVWSEPEDTVLAVPSHQAISPAVVQGAPHAPWQMWVVDAGEAGCEAGSTTVQYRASADGIAWGAPRATDLVQPGRVLWHLDVAWVPARAEYWALYTTYPAGETCVTRSLYLATSPDGITWKVPTAPIYRAGTNPIFRDVVYRSTMLPSADGEEVTLWLSGANYEGEAYHWKAAVVRQSTTALLQLGTGPAPMALDDIRVRRLPPPEPHDMRRGGP